MSKRSFFVKAVWDDEVGVFVTESDIIGLHVEAPDLDTFAAVVNEVAAELIVANHISASEFAETPLKDLIPAILWQPPVLPAAA